MLYPNDVEPDRPDRSPSSSDCTVPPVAVFVAISNVPMRRGRQVVERPHRTRFRREGVDLLRAGAVRPDRRSSSRCRDRRAVVERARAASAPSLRARAVHTRVVVRIDFVARDRSRRARSGPGDAIQPPWSAGAIGRGDVLRFRQAAVVDRLIGPNSTVYGETLKPSVRGSCRSSWCRPAACCRSTTWCRPGGSRAVSRCRIAVVLLRRKIS